MRGLELSEDLLKRNPESAEAARDVSVHLEKLGDFLAQRGGAGDGEQALKHYTRGLELREDLLKRNPDSALAARDVSVSLERLGGVLAWRGGAGDGEQALKHYIRGLELREDLLKRNPDSAQAARDVVVSQYKLGELYFKRHTFESAIAHFMAGIAVLDRMIAKGLSAERAVREKAILEGRLQRSREALATRRPESAAGR
jgi:tetratricopeptide (TPR) repeat protein